MNTMLGEALEEPWEPSLTICRLNSRWLSTLQGYLCMPLSIIRTISIHSTHTYSTHFIQGQRRQSRAVLCMMKWQSRWWRDVVYIQESQTSRHIQSWLRASNCPSLRSQQCLARLCSIWTYIYPCSCQHSPCDSPKSSTFWRFCKVQFLIRMVTNGEGPIALKVSACWAVAFLCADWAHRYTATQQILHVKFPACVQEKSVASEALPWPRPWYQMAAELLDPWTCL